MPLIEIKTTIEADLKTCFDLARNIDVHQESLSKSQEKAIAGKISGLIGLGEWVSWEAKHFGFVQHLTSRITEFDSPNYFVDEMVYGAFKSFKHKHSFKKDGDKTIMVDAFDFESPYGVIGKFANWLFLKRYMTNLLTTRNIYIKERAESL
ncbi:SRPBCC family protein [Confluentibacter sediminis]|uniref:SRPBCC family protein n=1 Tax=Confluentibacter sediminis TaxID=2219045 RepID=UPI000DAC745E|nr:SRPBCC family protein [Confluentibacter sediminis]